MGTRVILLAGAATILAGCASNPSIGSLTSEQRAKVTDIEVYASSPKRPYTVLGEVTGLSCNRNLYQEEGTSEQEAMEGIKIRVVLLSGDAVINTLCQKNSDADWDNNCWASVSCIGDAIKFN